MDGAVDSDYANTYIQRRNGCDMGNHPVRVEWLRWRYVDYSYSKRRDCLEHHYLANSGQPFQSKSHGKHSGKTHR